METTYADEKSGGAMQENYIPELTELALDNIDFSGEDKLNGAYPVYGATFTSGALVTYTSGIPINWLAMGNSRLGEIWEKENTYLPGIRSIGDVLAQEGYQQEFLIGSDGAFGSRSSYFVGHGNYKIFDCYTAIEKGYIPEDYYEWWGYEDEKLFAYTKTEILELASGDEPFNFTMLTVDTHFTDGYLCGRCEDKFDSQYSNVLSCSSKQVSEFVDWIKEQDFYENTTIVIVGDHLTMDSDYISNQNAQSHDRKAYVAIINPVEGCSESASKRQYTTMDIMLYLAQSIFSFYMM